MKKKLLMMAACLAVLAGCGSGTDLYPASTLTAEAGETVYEKAADFPAETDFPSRAYRAAFPENTDSSGSSFIKGTLTCNGTDFTVIVYESPQPLAAAMSVTGLCGKDGDTELVYEEKASGSGYINGYRAVYTAGMETFSLDGEEYQSYAVAYDLTLPDGDDGAVLYVSCMELADLGDAKVLLDEMVYSIREKENSSADGSAEESGDAGDAMEDDTESVAEELQEETEGTEEASGSAENSLDDVEFPTVSYSVLENGKGEATVTNEIDNNGYAATIIDYKFDVNVSMDEMVVLFSWSPSSSLPSSVWLENPSGAGFYEDIEFSYAGDYVFIADYVENGTYTLHIRTYESLYDVNVISMAKEVYYMMYLNIDEDGNPIRGM